MSARTDTDVKAFHLFNKEVEILEVETVESNREGEKPFKYDRVTINYEGAKLTGSTGYDNGLKVGKARVNIKILPGYNDTLKFKIQPGPKKTLGAS